MVLGVVCVCRELERIEAEKVGFICFPCMTARQSTPVTRSLGHADADPASYCVTAEKVK